jgi:DeoR/GlpR family transcriptional regulator of sugar metabolism
VTQVPRARNRASHERRFQLLQMVRDHGELEVTDANTLLSVSAETIRRDLRVLESQGLIRRSYGRVFPVESGAFETPLAARHQINPEEKIRIAAAVVPKIGEAQTLFLDEGFQTQLVAQRLPDDRRFTVVTSSLPIATLLAGRPNVQVITLGGRVRGNTLAVADVWAADMLRRLNVDLAIVGANGVSVERGMTTPDPAVAAVKSAAVQSSARRIFVGAHHKFGRTTFVTFAEFGEFEVIITGHELNAQPETADQRPVAEFWNPAGRHRDRQRAGAPGAARLHREAGRAAPGGDPGRGRGFGPVVGVPINVEGRLWGAVIVISPSQQPLPAGTEARLAGFTELVATALANAEAQAALTASRARIVTAADTTRRRIERDLHDGAHQRLVSLALELRAAQAAVPPETGALAAQLDRVADGLTGVLDELREIAHGVHPAILAEGGLCPALKSLARRSAVPVRLDLRADRRLPEQIELAAYYVVCEALTNTAKHAHASAVDVQVHAGERGLIGLKDRVEALGGRISLHSPPGAGTAAEIALPLTHPSRPEPPQAPANRITRTWPRSRTRTARHRREETEAGRPVVPKAMSPPLTSAFAARARRCAERRRACEHDRLSWRSV